jgi:hypothetical protein
MTSDIAAVLISSVPLVGTASRRRDGARGEFIGVISADSSLSGEQRGSEGGELG